MSKRYENDVIRGGTVELTVDGETILAYEGETIASVLLLEQKKSCYRTRTDSPRMMFCNMGTCYECRVRVQHLGRSNWLLACTTPVQPQMVIDTDVNLSMWIAGYSDGV